MLILKNKPHLFKIKTKHGSIESFSPKPDQQKILDKIESDLKTKGRSRLIIVKGRQLGVSTLCQLLAISYAMTTPAFASYSMCHDIPTATELFDTKVKFAFENLPPSLKNWYKAKRDNTRQLKFEGDLQNSSITIGLSSRGSTIDFLHVSEAGKMASNPKNWNEFISGALPSAEKAKVIVIESSADSGLSLFYEMVQEALNGKSEFDIIFLKWFDAEEYQETPPDNDWERDYQVLATRYNLYKDPCNEFGINKNQLYWYYLQARKLKDEVKVQYPFTIDEAFVSKSRTKFDIPTVRDHMQKARDPITINNDVKIYAEPINTRYVLTIDPASGLGEDYTGLKVRWNDGSRFREFASFKGKISEQEIAVIAVNLANYLNGFGKCLIMPETNIGSYLLDYIRRHYNDDLIYKRFYDDPTKQREGRIPDYGWKTTGQNRDLMINKFTELFIEGVIEVNDLEELKEMEKFVWNDDKMRYEAQSPYHDDLLFADFINIQGFDYVNQYL